MSCNHEETIIYYIERIERAEKKAHLAMCLWLVLSVVEVVLVFIK